MPPRISFDTETHLITDLCLAPPVVCTTWALEDGRSGIFDPRSAEGRSAVATWLRDYEIVGHNVAFDLAVLAGNGICGMPEIWQAYEENRIMDTMLREKLRDIAFGEFRWKHFADGSVERKNYGLADLSARRLGIAMSKGEDTWRLRYAELDGVSFDFWPNDATGYAIRDAQSTMAIFTDQERERCSLPVDVMIDQAPQARAAWWLHLMCCWGMPLDQTRVNALEEHVTTELARLQKILIDEGLVRIDRKRDGSVKKIVRDTAQVRAYMEQVCLEYDLPLRRTKKGGVCIDAQACEETEDPTLISYSQYTALGNVFGKDIARMRGAPRIHGNIDSLLETGRTSMRGFNLQNMRVDGDTRSCFVAPDGWLFCFIDLTAAELYGVAQICISMFGYSRLAEVLNSGEDPHVRLASTITGRTYEDLFAAVAQGDAHAKTARKLGKHTNYGLWGGMGDQRFAGHTKKLTHGEITLTIEEASRQRQGFLGTWPEAPHYLRHFSRLCREGPATIAQYRSGRIRGGLRYSQAANTGFQGLISDLMKDAGFRISREMYDRTRNSVLFGCRIVNFPHDEIISLVPEESAHECAHRIQDIVLSTGREWLPQVPPIGEVYLAKAWNKKAKPKFKEGRLIAWDS